MENAFFVLCFHVKLTNSLGYFCLLVNMAKVLNFHFRFQSIIRAVIISTLKKL